MADDFPDVRLLLRRLADPETAKTFEKIKQLAEEWHAKGGRIVFPHKAPSPTEVTLTPYCTGRFSLPKEVLDQPVQFVTCKGRVGTAMDCLFDMAFKDEDD